MCIRDSPNGEWGDKIMELMDTVDSYIPDPERDTDKPFLMPVEDVFTIDVYKRQNQYRIGLSRLERVVRERMTTQDLEGISPQSLIKVCLLYTSDKSSKWSYCKLSAVCCKL